MRPFFTAAAVALMLLIGSTVTKPACAADCPHYLVLEQLPGGQGNIVQARAYAYGWFGAARYSSSMWHKTYSGTGYRWTFVPGY